MLTFYRAQSICNLLFFCENNLSLKSLRDNPLLFYVQHKMEV